jgi:hypothetical protein
MSDQEKKLLTIAAIVGFVILNVLGFNFMKSQRIKVDAASKVAQDKLAMAEDFRAKREQITGEMEWLSQHEPEPAANQEIQSTLQQFVESEAKNSGLTIKQGQKPLPTDTNGKNYHRAKIQITVSGTEESLYRWFERLNTPDIFRIASEIRLSPNAQDDTKIDCLATIEQWFIPKSL